MITRFVTLLLTLVLLAASPAPAAAQPTPLPTRLVQQGDLVYQGSFTFSNAFSQCADGSRQWFSYVSGPVAFNPANNSLFVAGHIYCHGVAEWRVPAFGSAAPVLQQSSSSFAPLVPLTNPTDPNQKSLGGLLVVGDRLIGNGYSTYDAGSGAVSSHFVRSTDLSTGGATGPFRVGDRNPAFYAGYMGVVPEVWRSALGGDVLTGQCCLSIITRTSFGPSVSVVNSADLIAARNPTPATMLVGYPSEHRTLGGGNGPADSIYTQNSRPRGVVMPEGTASVLFIGAHGLGAYCYGEGAECGQPGAPKGPHSAPYVPYVWAYRVSDLADVKAGLKQPWDVLPYATWRLPEQITGANVSATYDPATGRIFVLDLRGDGDKPRGHVLTIRDAVTPPPPPPPVAVDCQVSDWTLGVWGDWTPLDATTETRDRLDTRTVTVPASNGGAACPGLTRTVTETRPVVIVTPPADVPLFSVDTAQPSSLGFTTAFEKDSISALTGAGWGVQFQRSRDGGVTWVSHGTRDTSAPFAKSATLPCGPVYHFRAVWTKTGLPPVIVLMGTRGCD